MEPEALTALDSVSGRTMADELQQYAAYSAGRHVATAGIPGAIVECGVWRGGCSMLMMRGLIDAGDTTRDVWLYDTFGGMTPPDERDSFLADGSAAQAMLAASPKLGATLVDWTVWCVADEGDVIAGISQTGYPQDLVRLVRGPVEETLLTHVPEQIAIARLDTDWYSSTEKELATLYDRISPGGVLILDDYDDWSGARQAVDDFFKARGESPFLVRAGFGRIHIKGK
jgi:O-methyltransferase